MNRIIRFIKYNNAFAIGVSLVLIATTSAFAISSDLREDAKELFISSQEIINSIDNSYIISVDLDNFDFSLQIQSITEDEANYYITYAYKTIKIEDYVWQIVEKEKTLVVSKEALGDKDLSLYVVEELGEVIDYQLSYLKEVQEIEEAKGSTLKIVTTQYAGLIGKFLEPEEKVFTGYESVVLKESEPEIVGEYTPYEPPSPESSETETLPEEESSGVSQPIVEEQPPFEEQLPPPELFDTEIIREIIQELLTQEQVEQESVCEPTAEICDGIDNNCNGLIDEDNVCQPVCQPTTEICGDNIDNNCDGIVDNPEICQAQPPAQEEPPDEEEPPTEEPPTCQPSEEICDNIDNDCDGSIDEDLGQTTCGIGACQVTINNCLDGQIQTCIPEKPIEEICDDQIDNDCDGKIDIDDEDCELECVPTDEICNSLDDDCDGLVDEDLIQQCGTTDVGVCQFGSQTCTDSVWGECIGAIEPTGEICDDGIDNNCDSQVDENCQVPENPENPEE